VGEFLQVLDANGESAVSQPGSPPVVGAIVNGELRELTYSLEMEAKVRPVTMGEADGMRIYRRSLTFLLETAFVELFPEASLTVDHSISSGGYYCQITGRDPLSAAELSRMEKRMRAYPPTASVS